LLLGLLLVSLCFGFRVVEPLIPGMAWAIVFVTACRPFRKLESACFARLSARPRGAPFSLPMRSGRELVILLGIVAAGAALRLWELGSAAPPGLNQDEASSIWNAYSLLKTGNDQHGSRGPSSRCVALARTEPRSSSTRSSPSKPTPG